MKLSKAFGSRAGVGISVGTVVAIVMGAPKFGDGLDWMRKVAGTTETAYAANERSISATQIAMENKEQFERYLEKQDAVAEALKDFVEQQAPNQAPTRTFIEYDEDGCWLCEGVSRQKECDTYQLWRPCDAKRETM